MPLLTQNNLGPSLQKQLSLVEKITSKTLFLTLSSNSMEVAAVTREEFKSHLVQEVGFESSELIFGN